MGHIYKRNKSWYLDLYVKGRRIRKKVGSSKRVAELALRDAEIKAERDEFGFTKRDILISKLFELFLEHSEANNRKTSTDRYHAVIDNFKKYLTEETKITFISELTTEHIDRYKIFRRKTKKDTRVVSSNTINFELDTIRLIFNQAIKWDYLKNNPTKGITRLKVDDAKPVRFLTEEECSIFLKNSPPDLYPIYFTFLNTGMRKGELENLQWNNIDLRRKKISIRSKKNWKPKTSERDIPVGSSLLVLLQNLKKKNKPKDSDYVFAINKSKSSRNVLRNELIKIAKVADIPNFTKIHTLRHTFASHLVMKGVDLPTVKKLMGHSDIQTTMIYAHLAQDHLSDAIDKLNF